MYELEYFVGLVEAGVVVEQHAHHLNVAGLRCGDQRRHRVLRAAAAEIEMKLYVREQ